MAVEATTSLPQGPKDATTPGYRIEGDKVVNDEFLDGFTFWDALDVINPLQHLPVIGTIYRELTGDELKSGPRIAGGVLFGGVVGLAGAALDVLSKELTGKDLGEHVVSMVDMAVDGEETVRAEKTPAPSGRAESAQALARDPTAPLDLLPPRWRMAANTGMGAAAVGGATPSVQGTLPSTLPLGDDAMAPLGGVPLSPTQSPTRPDPGGVEILLPARADAAPPATGTQVAGRAPVNPPLGDDALGSPRDTVTPTPAPTPAPNNALAEQTAALQRTIAQSTTEQAQTMAAAEPRTPRSLSETREFTGRTLADYQKRPIRFNAGRSTGPKATPTRLASPPVPQTPTADPAAMARLLEAQAATRSAAAEPALGGPSGTTAEGDVLRVGNPGQEPVSSTPTDAAPQDAWFAQKMMMGLEKYQKARGAVPLTRAMNVDA